MTAISRLRVHWLRWQCRQWQTLADLALTRERRILARLHTLAPRQW